MATSHQQNSFLHGVNEVYLAELYARFLDSPGSVDASWVAFFDDLQDDARDVLDELSGASWAPRDGKVIGNGDGLSISDAIAGALPERAPGRAKEARGAAASKDEVLQAARDSINALMLIRSYRVRGHLEADLDPLKLAEPEPHPELDLNTYGFTDEDMDRPIFINGVLGLEWATLGEIYKLLRDTYCGTIGVEFMHIQEPDQKAWIQSRIEGARNHTDFTARGKRAILDRLIHAEIFEKFLDKRYTGTKRFGLDGGESLIPALEQIMKRGGQLGLKEIVIGMPHRGRLNVLANMMGKPYQAIFSEFQGNTSHPEDVQGAGDVKYHLGTSSDREFDGNKIHLSLTANPSHLEAVNTVVLGKVRAKQTQLVNETRDQVMGLLMHGDAAFAGQGLVAETLDMSQLRGYRTGGTIHVIVNNQIGFTTMPAYHRSGPYCSEWAKIIQAPIFHVNGDDPEAVVHISRVAMEFRQEFKKDVIIDLFCYRRHGHNEGDEPMFTQPLMYKKIAQQRTTREIYSDQLVAEGVLTAAEVDQMVGDFEATLEQDFEAASSYKPNQADWLEGAWTGIESARGEARRGKTGVANKTLKKIGHALTQIPDDFNANSKINRQFRTRGDRIEAGEGIDWATAEALAFGTLLVEGTPVRLSGQDCGRGTFSQRHAMIVDQETERKLVSLDYLQDGQAKFEIMDSPLSEAGVLGFEYGYTLAEPNVLVLWEAQFGDFANGAQMIIDQFIVSGESKWLRLSGLVMLLPHGFEGQGPEHSSARLERFLQLCGDDNIQVANCTTPANYFHILRRQVRREFRKPLILMTPKSLLRHRLCVSPLEDFAADSTFHRVLWDRGEVAKDSAIKRVVLCSGKVYYDLFEERAKRGEKQVYLMRVEQLYPIPYKALAKELKRFGKADIVWCQEEPKNMGAWSHIEPYLEEVLGQIGAAQKRPTYVGRPAAASPATGQMSRHVKEQDALVDEALSIK
jgi:2-oxoglutarate dehydrogenase E1 component